MSRSAKRVRLRLTITAHTVVDSEERVRRFVCRTRDVSLTGCLLETAEQLEPGTTLALHALDPDSGDTVELRAVVMRAGLSPTPGMQSAGVRLVEPGPEWVRLVARAHSRTRDTIMVERPARRLRVLVVADDIARRGAMALYVTSGWDVRFASDLAGAEEALRGLHLDAVIAEHELESGQWAPVLEAAQRAQPDARRIVRTTLSGRPAPPPGAHTDLVHRVVDLQAGLEAVLDALAADWGA